MTLMRRLSLILANCACLLFGLVVPLQAAKAQDAPLEMNFVTFPFPSMSNTMTDIVIAKGFDRANGIIAKPVSYGTAGALWAAIAKGELLAHNMGPYTLPQIRSEGVKVAIYSTLMRLSSEQIVTRNPEIKKFEHLKGRTLAAMVGFPEYDYLQMYARKLGFELADQMTVINATPALARAQLEAGRADAIMVWEPSATMILRSNPDAHVILTGDEMWTALSGTTGWQGMNYVNMDLVKSRPDIVMKLLTIHQQAGAWLNTHPDEADEIISSNKYNSKDVPKGTMADAINSGRLYYDVLPAWEPAVNKRIWDTFRLGVEYKAIKALPPGDSVISARPQQ
jgi:ABC-type nitrate/sulfonate/bicarbonate transport system substrate-binding protein